MGAKITKQDQVFEQRFNYLKSMASEVADYIDHYGEEEGREPKVIFRKEPISSGNLRVDILKTLNSPSPRKGLGFAYEFGQNSADLRSRPTDKDTDKDSARSKPLLKKISEVFSGVPDSAFDYMHFNLDPLTPTTFLKQSKGKMDEEMKSQLEGLVAKKSINLDNIRICLHSEIPLDDEKPMEEKSCKVEDNSKAHGADDFEKDTKKLNQDAEEAWDVYENNKHQFYKVGVAVSCRKGEALDAPNQDNYFVYVDAYTKVYCVCDGHGPYGNLVSHFISVHFAKILLEDPIYLVDPIGAIKECFIKGENYLKSHIARKNAPFDIHLSGTCCTIVVQRSNMVYIGQLGDCKVMIGRRSKNKKGMTLEQLTYDHVPYALEEKKRIYAKGGEVRVWNGDGDERVFAKGRVYPCLATTRSIGDEIGSLIGIISEPEICSLDISPASDVFLLIGSSPVFTYLDDNEILNVMNYANVSKIRETTDILIKKAKNAWIQNENTFDDMTLIISYLS